MTKAPALLLALLLVLPLPVGAADEPPREDTDAQESVQEGLRELRGDMEALVEELRRTGREYEAGLIEAGLEHLDASRLDAALLEVIGALEARQRGKAHEASARVLQSLERLLLILEDRDRAHTREEIESRLKAVEDALELADSLESREREVQKRIQEVLERTRTDAGKEAEAIRQGIEDLKERQAALETERRRQAARKAELEAAKAALDDLEARQAREREAALNEALEQDVPKREAAAERQAALGDQAKATGEAMEQSRQEKVREAGQETKKATEPMKQAAEALEKGEPREAGESQQKALEGLEQAKAKLGEAGAKLSAEDEKLDQRQQALAKEAEAVARKIEALRAEDAQRQDRKEGAASAMQQASAAMQKPGGEAEAREALEKASRFLKDLADEHEPDRDALQELKDEQKKIRERLKQLEDILDKAESEGAKQAAQQARQAMEQAEDRMESGQGVQAEESAEEAAEQLEQVKKELEQEERRYQDLVQEELLFRMAQDLDAFVKEQREIRDATQTIAEEAGGRSKLPRALRRQVGRLEKREGALAEKAEQRLEAIRDEGSIAFFAVFEEAFLDMQEIERLLGQRDVGPLTIALQDEVLQRLDDLIGGFKDEIERRREEEQPPSQQGGGGQQKPRLVPPLTEIKLIRRRQMDLNLKIENFWRRNPSIREGKITEDQRRLLERLYHQQGRLSRLLEKLKGSVFGQ